MKKKALLVGINDYTEAPLKGCVNDVLLAQSKLLEHGYEIRVLLNKDATKNNIMREFESLLQGSSKEDCLLFHFSGHGSQVPDTSGDEEDGLDECLLPVDFTWENVILDDDLDAVLQKYKGAHVEIILDACHSGSGTRSVLEAHDPMHYTLQRFIQPPMHLFEHINVNNHSVSHYKLRNVVTWSGCKSDQTSADGEFDVPRGVFSYAFYSNGIKNRKCMLEYIRHFIAQRAFSQIPQLDCSFTQRGTGALSGEKSFFKSLYASIMSCKN